MTTIPIARKIPKPIITFSEKKHCLGQLVWVGPSSLDLLRLLYILYMEIVNRQRRVPKIAILGIISQRVKLVQFDAQLRRQRYVRIDFSFTNYFLVAIDGRCA